MKTTWRPSTRLTFNACLTLLLPALQVGAATFTVNSTIDAVDASPGNGVCRTSGGVCTLRAAIQEANATSGADTIEIPAGTYTITRAPLNENSITTGDLDITRPLTILRSSGVVIIQAGPPPAGSPPTHTALDRLFEIHPTAGNVTLSNLTLRGGWDAKEGGALYNASPGTVRLIRLNVMNNTAMASGGAIYHDGLAGGALVVDRSFILDNASGGEGGAIYIGSGRLTVTNSTISANAARNGGGIYSAGRLSQAGLPARVEVANTILSENSAAASGGAIANDLQGDLVLSDVSVTGNTAEGEGGGVATVGKSTLAITRGVFSGNACADAGGGVSTATEGAVTIDASEFSENSAEEGGGLMLDGKGPARVVDSIFSENAVTGEGGGIGIDSDGVVEIADCMVLGNSAGLRGGGILNSGALVTFERLTISGNSALSDGGGIDNQSSGQFTILDSSITSNTAENGGGFANVADATMLISRSLFWDNRASGVGGGFLHRSDGASEMENCTLSGNHAGEIGGGLMLDADADLHVVNVTITGNTAPLGAGVGTPNGVVNVPVVSNPQSIFRNTIVAGNFGDSECYGAFTSEGGNIDGGTSCYLQTPSDHVNVIPAMGPLANNGGRTMTHALLAGSRAIDAGVNPCPPTDQRGVSRPQGNGCDCGAFEFDGTSGPPPPPPPPASITVTATANADSWIDQNSPADNKGADSTLKVQCKEPNQNLRALVRFPLPALPSGSVIQSATLRLFAASSANGRTLQALRVTGAWAESSVNWSSQPATSGPAATTRSVLGNVNWNVTSQVKDMYSSGNQGFLIRDSVESVESFEQQFHSREKGSNPPTLVIEYIPPSQ